MKAISERVRKDWSKQVHQLKLDTAGGKSKGKNASKPGVLKFP
jgi:hypothetical protein